MRRALVTGGSRGIGLGIAQKLARDGPDVVVTYARGARDAARAVGNARAEGLHITAAACDARDPAAYAALFQPGGPLFGEDILVLVHAAGFTRDKLLLTMPPADFDDV